MTLARSEQANRSDAFAQFEGRTRRNQIEMVNAALTGLSEAATAEILGKVLVQKLGAARAEKIGELVSRAAHIAAREGL